MDSADGRDGSPAGERTTSERLSDRELVVRHTFEASPARVYAAWTTPAVLKRWWTPRSLGVELLSCELDAREGGEYRFVMSHAASQQTMTFFGHYLEVAAPARLVWTNEEGGEAGQTTTLTLEEADGGTRLRMHELYPLKAALDAAMEAGGACGFNETFAQLDALLATSGDG